jgi:hypothetical protein
MPSFDVSVCEYRAARRRRIAERAKETGERDGD